MTRKEIINNFSKVYKVGYCDLQYLLRGKNRIGYNSGVYGWNYDVYSLDGGNIAICTGYGNMPGVRIDSDIIQKYNSKAEAICKEYFRYDEVQKRLNKLIEKFIEEIQA